MERLKQYLSDEKLTQTELARRMNVSQPTVWEWLNGDAFPSAKKLKALAALTGISIDELLGSSRRPKRVTALSA